MATAYRNSTAYRTSTLDYRGNATGGTTQETTASLTVAPATAAEGVRAAETTASLDSTPAFTAESSVVKATNAALDPTPATAAESTAVKATTATLDPTPATAAEPTGLRSTTASLDPTPATSATGVREQSTTASLYPTPATSATADRAAATTATLSVDPATAAEGTAWKVAVNDGSSATDVSGTWSDEALAWDDTATTYATATGVGTHTLDIGGYDFGSVVGAADELVSLVLNVSQYVSDGSRFSSPTVQAWDGATPIGSPIALAERTTEGSEDVTVTGITLAQIRSADFKVRFVVEQTS